MPVIIILFSAIMIRK